MNKIPNIAIIGAGFSGILLCCQLALQATKPFSLTIFEKDAHFAKGIAFRTKSPFHFLNVKASHMSAFPDDPSHFLTWLKNHKNLWQPLHASFHNLEIAKDAYLPRIIYGAYLQWIWDEIVQKKIKVAIVAKEVRGLPDYDAIILACGVPDNKTFPIQHKNFTQNIWKPHAESILLAKDLSHLSSETHIAIIGSGLTMLDALATLEEKHYTGAITVISNDGKLSEPHLQLDPNPPKFLQSLPHSALSLLKAVRIGISEAPDWRYVIDELRPNTQKIWQSLSKREKKKLLPLLPIWNRHRHRMPSQYVQLLERTKQNNTFQHIAGSIQDIKSDGNIFTLTLKKDSVNADYIFNCSGPEMHLEKNRSPLIQHLLSNEMLQPDALNLGALVDENDSLIGKAQGSLYALGQLLFGTKLEITAVPELRENCRKMAEHLCKKFSI